MFFPTLHPSANIGGSGGPQVAMVLQPSIHHDLKEVAGFREQPLDGGPGSQLTPSGHWIASPELIYKGELESTGLIEVVDEEFPPLPPKYGYRFTIIPDGSTSDLSVYEALHGWLQTYLQASAPLQIEL